MAGENQLSEQIPFTAQSRREFMGHKQNDEAMTQFCPH